MVKVLTFGTFDGFHGGHRAMLQQAKALGNWLVVIVAPDSVVIELKGESPEHGSAQRITMLKNERIADEVALGDLLPGSWKILKKYRPDIIALGYDQEELRQSLIDHFGARQSEDTEGDRRVANLSKSPRIVILSAHKPDSLHTKLINKKR